MFFIPLDNQLHFLLLTLLPTYLVFTALTWDRTDSPKRLHGLLFAAPLALAVFSFLNAPVRREQAEYLLYAAGLSMVLMLLLSEFASRHTTSSHVGILVALLFPLFFLVSESFFPLLLLNQWAPWLIGASGVILAGLLLYALLKKRHADAQRLFGGVFISTGMLLFHLPLRAPAALLSHLLLLIGLCLCALAMYRNTYANLRELVTSHETRLRKLDANLHTEVIQRVASIEKSNRVLLEKARTDSLTGLFSKPAIVNHADTHIQRSPREELSLIMLDLDNFKGINDKLGHQVGDQCLKSLASIARASFRANDILGRYGGDEFIFLLPGTPANMAITVAERFRRNIEVGSNPKFTVSIGISTYPQDGKIVREIIDAADQALYRSKEQGRNRVSHLSYTGEAAEEQQGLRT